MRLTVVKARAKKHACVGAPDQACSYDLPHVMVGKMYERVRPPRPAETTPTAKQRPSGVRSDAHASALPHRLDRIGVEPSAPVPASPPSDRAPIQRLVVRARDLLEQIGIGSPTIADAAKKLKAYPLFGNKDTWKEDVGIGQVSSMKRKLDADEPLVVVGHGAEPTLSFFGNIKGDFAQRSPVDLAGDLLVAMPDGFSGDIFLNGCYTGMRYQYTKEGSSYIERFGDALNAKLNQAKRKAYTGVIKGNIGAAATGSASVEWIEVTKEVYDAWHAVAADFTTTSKDGTKYKLKGDLMNPIGQAFYAPSTRAYSDSGFLTMMKKK